MIDTHAHLDFPQFDKNRKETIEYAFSCGVEKIINVGTDLESSNRSVRLATAYSPIYAAVGFHPNDAKKLNEQSLQNLRTLAQHEKVVAIGEIGLDFYHKSSSAELQKQIFILQLDLALELDLPVVVHIRNAYPESLGILETKKELRGVLHCFEGDVGQAKRALDLGFYISFNGKITYNNPSLVSLTKQIPLDRILVETDCPYLPPHPHRGEINQPAWVELVIRKIAQVRQTLSFENAEKITTSNACLLFGWEND